MAAPVDDSTVDKNFSLHSDFEERKKLNPKQMIAKIDEWVLAGKYEDDMDSLGNQGYHLVSQAVNEYYQCRNIDRDGVKIIDVAAGTGLVAGELKRLGFKHIDGIDPSSEMMNVARKRDVYTDYYLEYVDGHRMKIKTDGYDCAVVSGGFSQSFMPTNALFEIVRLVKPGGIVCFEMIESNLVRVEEFVDRLEPLWNTFTEKGIWENVRKDIIPELIKGENGLLMIYQVNVTDVHIPQLPALNHN